MQFDKVKNKGQLLWATVVAVSSCVLEHEIMQAVGIGNSTLQSIVAKAMVWCALWFLLLLFSFSGMYEQMLDLLPRHSQVRAVPRTSRCGV